MLRQAGLSTLDRLGRQGNILVPRKTGIAKLMATKKTTIRNQAAKPAKQPKQKFTINAPAALRVLLAGDFTQWQANAIPMKKGTDGFWHAEVELAPGTYHYRFLVDGDWQNDPECTLHVPNPFGTSNSVREIR